MAQPFAYRRGVSFLHRADPISKLAWLLSVMVLAFVLPTLIAEAVLLAVVVVTALTLARMPPVDLWHAVRYLVIVSVSFVVVQAFLYLGSTPILGPGIARPTWEGLAQGTTFAIRLITLGTASLAFTLTTDPRSLAYEAIRRGHLPYRYVFMVLAGLRFMPVLEEELAHIRNAHAVRGALRPDAGMLESARHVKQFTVPLLVRGLSRAQKGSLAMEARGFGVAATRTFMDPPPTRWFPGVLHGALYLAATMVVVASNFGALAHLVGSGVGTR
jgi:energy-coupling factor transport system permease protein